MLSGCLDKSVSNTMECGGGELVDDNWWGDHYQWNALPMSYGNTTNWTINNTSSGVLDVVIEIGAYFSEAVGPLEQGWLNISLIQNETVLWQNQTSESGVWNVSIPVNTSQEVWLEIKATGKDTHPENDYGDYFVVKFNGRTMTPEWCE